MFKNIKEKFHSLNKNFILAILGLIIISIFAYFPNSKAFTLLSKPQLVSTNSNAISYAKNSMIRDYKIPEILNSKEAGLNNTFKSQKIVVIDPGHGGIDPGTSIPGLNEKDVSLDIALKTNNILIEKGITTVMTRDSDVFVDLKGRIDMANTYKASLFLSIHCNSFTDSARKGTTTLYYPSQTLSSGKLYEKEYANIIQSELIQTLNTFDLGISDRPNLAVLHHAKMPSVIVELGFITNSSDVKLLSSQDFGDKCAKALADGIIKSLEKID